MMLAVWFVKSGVVLRKFVSRSRSACPAPTKSVRWSDPAGTFGLRRVGGWAARLSRHNEPTTDHRLLAAQLPTRFHLLPQHRQQAAVVLLRLFSALQPQQAGIYQVGKVLYGVGTVRRVGHGRDGEG